MTMIAFHVLFPEVAKREARTVAPVGHDELPDDTYLFMELYCVDPACDCRRVMLNVVAADRNEHVATINHAFEPPADDSWGEEQTFLDPLNPQSRHSQVLLELFESVVLDRSYQKRLERHYAMVKEAVRDPDHPAQRAVASLREAGSTVRRTQPKISRNAPCPCGSNKKYKKCCGRPGASPPAAGGAQRRSDDPGDVGDSARQVIASVFEHPPFNDAELRQRLVGLDADAARLALIGLLDAGEVDAAHAGLFRAAAGIVDLAHDSGRLIDLIERHRGDSVVQSMALSALGERVGEAMPELAAIVSQRELERAMAQPMVDLLAAMQSHPEAAEALAEILLKAPEDVRVALWEEVDALREQSGTPAAAAYGPALQETGLADLHGRMIAAVADEPTPQSIALLEQLKSAARPGAAPEETSRAIQRALLQMRTRGLDPESQAEVEGSALVSSCDGQGAFVVLGCFANPDGSTTIADLCIRAAAEIRDGFVLARQSEEDLDDLVEQLESGSTEMAEVPLSTATALVRSAVQRTEDLGIEIPADARAAVAWFDRVALAEAPDAQLEPARRPTLAQMRELVSLPEYGSWFFDLGDLRSAGISPPPAGDRTRWAREVVTRLDSPELRARLIGMTEHMVRWHSWRGEPERARRCAAAARSLRGDLRRCALARAMLERGPAPLEVDERDQRWVANPLVRQALKTLFYADVSDPQGRDVAALDFGEAAWSVLEAASGLLPGHRRPRAEEHHALAHAIGATFPESLIAASKASSEVPREQLMRPIVAAMRRASRLDEGECLELLSASIPHLLGFVDEVCTGCPVGCLSRLDAPMAEAFFSPDHPALS